MAKFRGLVGYNQGTKQVKPGVWKDDILERMQRGDVLNNARRLEETDKVNFDLAVSNSISIVSDAYAREHFFAIRYVEWAGALWTVQTVEVKSPRLILRLGGVYNGPRGTAPGV